MALSTIAEDRHYMLLTLQTISDRLDLLVQTDKFYKEVSEDVADAILDLDEYIVKPALRLMKGGKDA